jgi:hypothetical protein
MQSNRKTKIMDTSSPFAHEVQGTVARLLANENVQIHRSIDYKTAFFDLENRVLGLPVFKDMPTAVYDLFIGHETAHALFTKIEDTRSFIDKYGNHSLYNILEDIRIEKLAQKTYPGLVVPFTKGYTHLHSKDFFGDLNDEMHFLDRLNVMAKVGKRLFNPEFTTEEQELVDAAMAINTHDELVAVAEKILKFMDDENDQDEEQPQPEQASDQGCPGEGEGEEEEIEAPGEDDNGEGGGDEGDSIPDDGTESHSRQEQIDQALEDMLNTLEENDLLESGENPYNEQNSAGEGGNVSDFESQTQKAFDEKLEENRMDHTHDRGYASPGTPGLDDIQFIAPSWETVNSHIYSYQELFEIRDNCEFYNNWHGDRTNERYIDFRKKHRKTVSLLRNEFDRKKSAYEYSRARVSKCGTIDVNRVHRYKYSEDIFASVTELAQAKSHGIVFLIDWSGSMGGLIAEVIEKTLILTEFCRLSKIPFEVYAFTDRWCETENAKARVKGKMIKAKCNHEIDLRGTVLFQMLSSKMNAKDYARGCQDLFYSTSNYGLGRTYHGISRFEGMGGTPLLSSLVMSNMIIERFKKENKLQCVNFVLLSDGEGSELSFKTTDKLTGDPRSFQLNRGRSAYGKLNGKKLVLGSQEIVDSYQRWNGNYDVMYTQLVEHMKSSMNVTTTCFYIFGRKPSQHCINRVAGGELPWNESGKIIKSVRKNRIYALTNTRGFEKFILMYDKEKYTPHHESFGDVDLSEDVLGSEAKIARAFMNYNSSSNTRKIFAREFIETATSGF